MLPFCTVCKSRFSPAKGDFDPKSNRGICDECDGSVATGSMMFRATTARRVPTLHLEITDTVVREAIADKAALAARHCTARRIARETNQSRQQSAADRRAEIARRNAMSPEEREQENRQRDQQRRMEQRTNGTRRDVRDVWARHQLVQASLTPDTTKVPSQELATHQVPYKKRSPQKPPDTTAEELGDMTLIVTRPNDGLRHFRISE